ncbi:hypothetical protein ACP3V7_24620, partial [Salmonella enterica]|uniref:hypothetical protein n=1 Tax=Salmonella enterica TaxID=28901 RepID=UPI003CFAF835
RSEKLDIKPETTLKDVRIGARLGSDGRTYVFVFNSNEREARTGEIRFKVGAGDVTLPVNLPPFDFRIAVLPRLGESAATWWP